MQGLQQWVSVISDPLALFQDMQYLMTNNQHRRFFFLQDKKTSWFLFTETHSHQMFDIQGGRIELTLFQHLEKSSQTAFQSQADELTDITLLKQEFSLLTLLVSSNGSTSARLILNPEVAE